MQISEARLNDIVYLTLKHFFFVPVYGENASPRECDIRVCMDMACPARITSISSAILLPNEVSGKSHTKLYDVESDHVLDVCLDYLEDHWMKQTFEEAYGNEDIKTEMKAHFETIIATCLGMPEDQCGG